MQEFIPQRLAETEKRYYGLTLAREKRDRITVKRGCDGTIMRTTIRLRRIGRDCSRGENETST